MKKMDPYFKAKLMLLLKLVFFIGFTALVIIGQGIDGFTGIGIMLLGLIGLLGLLYIYNRSYVDRKKKTSKK